MGLLSFIEGFDHYGDFLNEYRGKWSSVFGVFAMVTGRNGGNALRISGGNSNYVRRSIGSVDAISVGFAVKIPQSKFGSIVSPLFEVTGNIIDRAATLWLASDGSLFWTNGGFATDPTIFISNKAVVPNVWQFIEVVVDLQNTSVGSLSLHINGADAGSVEGVRTIELASQPTGFGIRGASDPIDYDDIYLYTNHQAFAGDCYVSTLWPDEDVAVEFERSGGVTNFENVDDESPDDDMTYVSSDGLGTRDLYRFSPNVSGVVSIVKGVQITRRARAITDSSRPQRGVFKSGVSVQVSSGEAVTGDYTYQTAVSEIDPETDVAWTPASVDAGEFGFENI